MNWYHGTRHRIDGDHILPGDMAGKPSNYPDLCLALGQQPTTWYAWASSSIAGAASFGLTCKADGEPVVYEVMPYGFVEPDPRVFGAIRVSGKLRIVGLVGPEIWAPVVDREDGAC